MTKIRIDKMKMKAMLLFAFLFLCCLPVLHASADELSKEDVIIDYANELIAVRANENKNLSFCFTVSGKEGKNFQTIGKEQISRYGEGENAYDAFYIDFSAQSLKQATSFLVGYGTNPPSLTLTLPARGQLKAEYNGVLSQDEIGQNYQNAYTVEQDGKPLYVYFSSETGYLSFFYDDVVYTDLDTIEWRAGVAMNYRPLSELNLLIYRAQGATLYFRVKTKEEPISKEAKLKISKEAKAPEVKLDGNKLTIAMKKTQEYRLVYEDGSCTEWVDVKDDTKPMKLAALSGMQGNGITSEFPKVRIQVRTAATEHRCPSATKTFERIKPADPVEGSAGIQVSRVNPSDLTKGLNIKNNTTQEYLIAIADKESFDCKGDIGKLIGKLDYSATSESEGMLIWKNLKAGKSMRISYGAFQNFEDSYVVLYRVAAIREDTKTSEKEFRISSRVCAYGGILPTADLKSQAFLLKQNETTQKTVTFTKQEGWTLYTSFADAGFARNEAYSVSFQAKIGDTVIVQAYLQENDTGRKSDVVTFRYQFVADGELEAYSNDWGYLLCKKKGWAVAYQRAYLAAITYQDTFSFADLSMTYQEVMQVIQMMRLDHPEIIQLTNTYSIRGTDFTLGFKDKTEMDALLMECQETANQALADIRAKYSGSPTKIEYVKEIHDYLILKKQYKSSAMDQTMVGSLSEDYTPVCMSYALAFSYLCELAGIQTVVIHGDATNRSGHTESHVWNMVNLGNEIDYSTMKTADGAGINSDDWYEIDLTWDDPIGAADHYIGYDYFNLTTNGMNNHSSSTSRERSIAKAYDAYPVERCTGTTYDYEYLVENGYVSP